MREASWKPNFCILRFRPPGESLQFVCNRAALIQDTTALIPQPFVCGRCSDSGSCRLQEGCLEEVTVVEVTIPQPLRRSSILQEGHL